MTIYLDASVIVPVLVIDAHREAAIRYIETVPRPLVMSEYAAGETASAIARLFRTRLVTADRAAAIFATLDAWRASECTQLAIDDSDIVAAAQLVRELPLKLRMPDALHLALCRRHGYVLATFDERLADAGAAAGIEVDVPIQPGVAR